MQLLRKVFVPIGRHIGFIAVAAALVFCVIHLFDPPRLNWGDSGSDYNVMTSGRNFVKYGFFKLHLTPHLLDPASIVTDRDRVYVYTHYPQLSDLMNGLERKLFGFSRIEHFRVVALLFSFGSLFFIYRLTADYWGRMTSQVALALWVWNPLWLQHADYLHHVPYAAFFGFGSVYWLRRYFANGRRRWLILSGAFLSLTYLASYDWWFFGPLLLAGATMWHYRAVVSRPVITTLAVLASFAVGALAFKLGTNMWALGGVEAFLDDFHFQLRERATDVVTRTSYRNGAWPTAVGRIERFFTLLLFPIAAFWLVYPALRHRIAALREPVVNPGVLFLAALPFLVIFTEMWVAQFYPAVLVIPFYAVGTAAIVAILWRLQHRVARPVAVLLVVLLLANSTDENLAFPAAFFPEDVAARMRAQIDSISPPNQELLINHVFDAPYRYYMNRKVVSVTLIPPGVAELGLVSFAEPQRHPETATAQGAILVQHKRVVHELYDKGYYYLFAKLRLWDAWGNPRAYRRFVDSLVADRDSTLFSRATRVGRKVYDDEFYAIWRIDRQPALMTTPPPPGRDGSPGR